MRWILVAALLCCPPTIALALADHVVDQVVEEHILPGYAQLEAATHRLSDAAEADCAPASQGLRSAFHGVFDAWLSVSHLRFGPSEVEHRAFAIAFWPDPRGKMPKTLRRLMADENPIVADPVAFSGSSVAGRGIYALERLLFDPEFAERGVKTYHCALVRAIADDLVLTAAAISADWRQGYAEEMLRAGRHGSRYRTPLEAQQELLKALNVGLQITSDQRLGRPLGTFERPRPRRAEARLSGRSLHNVRVSLTALRAYAHSLSSAYPEVQERLGQAFDAALAETDTLSADPVFASVATVQGRLRVEVLQQRVDDIRAVVRAQLGPAMGIGEGFNALDGD